MRAAGDVRVQRIRATVDAIPPGEVRTYGQVAEESGLPGRARLVGSVLGQAGAHTELPWHRVVAAGGRIATQGSAAETQVRRLRAEGVRFRGAKVVLTHPK